MKIFMTDDDSHFFRNMTPIHVHLDKRKYILSNLFRNKLHNVTVRTLAYPYMESHIFWWVLPASIISLC